VKGEVVGGCDILTEMFQDGELQQHLAQKDIAFEKRSAPA